MGEVIRLHGLRAVPMADGRYRVESDVDPRPLTPPKPVLRRLWHRWLLLAFGLAALLSFALSACG